VPKIRDVIKLVEADGWRLDRVRGSHRHFKHATKRGTVTIPGHPGDHVGPQLWRSILNQAGLLRQDGCE